MKGIILAVVSCTRLYPLTLVMSKQLLPPSLAGMSTSVSKMSLSSPPISIEPDDSSSVAKSSSSRVSSNSLESSLAEDGAGVASASRLSSNSILSPT